MDYIISDKELLETLKIPYTIKELQEVYKKTYNAEKVKLNKKQKKAVLMTELGRRIFESPLEKGVVFKNSDQVFNHYKSLKFSDIEKMDVITLDHRHQIINIYTTSVGNIGSTCLDPKLILKKAVLDSATSIILVHNHPSGDPVPSQEDLFATKRMVKAADILNIRFLDHIIIGNSKYHSLADNNQLE
jgi:DNA repair protein RadC